MLPNTKNNSKQVTRMLYSKVKVDHATKNAKSSAKKLQELEEIFTQHSNPATGRVTSSIALSPQQLDKSNASRKKYVYPFIMETAETAETAETVKTAETNGNNGTGETSKDHHICVFRVFDNNGQFDPFLQFKLQRRPDDATLKFPTFEPRQRASSDASNYKIAADQAIKTLFPDAFEKQGIKFICRRTDPVTGHTYAVYEETLAIAETQPKSGSMKDEWWWACVHEIMNRNKILSIDIHAAVVDLFEHVPSIMFLYDGVTGEVMETPHVLYSGITEGSSPEEMKLLGPRKLLDNAFMSDDNDKHSIIDPNELRIYGSQYYLYEYENVFRSACYAMADGTNATNARKNSEYVKRSVAPPHLVRYAVFLGNTSTTVFDTTNSTTNPSIDGFREYFNTSWSTSGYNSAHHGEYAISSHKRVNNRSSRITPVFCVCNIERIVTLSHYKINFETVPAKYNDDEPNTAYEIY